MDIVEGFAARIRGQGRTVVLPEAGDERVLRAAAELVRRGLARPVLVGEEAGVAQTARALGVSLAGCEVWSPVSDPALPRLAAALAASRPSLTPQTALRLLKKPLYFAGMLLAAGKADAMVAGADNPTRRIIEARCGLAPRSADRRDSRAQDAQRGERACRLSRSWRSEE